MELEFCVEGLDVTEVVVVSEGQTIADIVAILAPKAGIGVEEAVIFLGEGDESADLTAVVFHPDHVGKKHHLHRRGRHIDVLVSFDGRQASRSFPSSAKVNTVLVWATEEFKPERHCPAGAALTLRDGTAELAGWQRIGSLAPYPDKQLALDLLEFVHVTVDEVRHKLRAADYIVSEFKAIVGVAAIRQLNEVIDRVFTPLDDNAPLKINGCEVFVSQNRSASSS